MKIANCRLTINFAIGNWKWLACHWGDARVAHNVVRGSEFGDDFRSLKLAQNLRRPHAMRSAFAYGSVVNAHEFESRGHEGPGVDQGKSPRATFGQRKL